MWEDDDDFDFENEPELLAATSFVDYDQPTNEVLCFDCNGEDSVTKNQFKSGGFIRNYDTNFLRSTGVVEDSSIQTFKLFSNEFDPDTLTSPIILNVLFNKAKANVQLLGLSSRENAVTISNQSYYDLRMEVTGLLFYIRKMLRENRLDTDLALDHLQLFRINLNAMENMPIMKVIHSANSGSGNESTSSAYHLLHGQLEWRWLYLTIILEITKIEGIHNKSLRETLFENELELLIFDLIILSMYKFNKLKLVDLFYKTPFLCTCIKELWLLVQLLIEQFNLNNECQSFWFYFNKSLNGLREGRNPYETFYKVIGNKMPSVNTVLPTSWNQFSLWILSGLAKLNGFTENGKYVGSGSLRIKDNFELIENTTKSFLNSDPKEELLRLHLNFIVPLITEWWSPKTDIVMILWEYFHKKLNLPFFVPGSTPNALATVTQSVIGYLDQIKSKLESPSLNPNETSYSIFICLLGKILKKLETVEGSQIKKILGRIISKFSTTKLLALNETGIHNIVTLFITLALSSNQIEITQRIQHFLLQIPLMKVTQSNRQIALIKGHVSLMILSVDQHFDVSQYVPKILEQLNSIHLDEGYMASTRVLAEGFLEIFSKCESFQSGEYLLLDLWLIKYLSASSSNEQERILECLNSTLIKVPTLQYSLDPDSAEHTNLNKLLESIHKFILPYVKKIFAAPQTESMKIIPELAANLCLITTIPAGRIGSREFDKELFKYFIESNCNILNLTQFLVLILSTDQINFIDSSVIIRNWIRCNICSISYSKDLKTLTNIVVSLEEFHIICDSDTEEVINATDPICTFFSEIGKSYSSTTDYRRKMVISEKVFNYLTSFEKYVTVNADNLMKVYSMIGIIILHCSQIVYIKGKNASFFNIAMNQYILPNSLLITNKSPSLQVTQAVHKIWHLLITGIEKLDLKNDGHISKMLSNLIEKWLPHFKFSPNKQVNVKPFVYCINESSELMVTFVFEKIASVFLALKARQPNEHASQVLTIFIEVLTSCYENEEKIKLLLKCSTQILMDHAMMTEELVVSKKLIFEFFEHLFRSPVYLASTDLQNLILQELQSLTDKKISFYSTFYFQFMLKLVKINPDLCKANMDHLRNQVTVVECLRGVGRDGKLRNDLERLEGAIIACKS